ncbi:MAG: mechanosensitive ion channel [Xanthobacteraceae bacterium]|nr:mechanosensitive ion channel [Xanthobacteraceae bacterium]
MDQMERTLEGLAEAGRWLAVELTSFWFLLQLAVILGVALIAWAVGALARRRVDPLDLTMGWPPMLRLAMRAVLDRIGLIVFVAAAFTAQAVIAASTWPSNGYLVGIAAKLASAWLVIGLLASVIRNRFLFSTVAVSAFLIAALSIVGLMEQATAALDAAALVIGGLRISLLLALKTAAFMLVALWFAVALANFADRRLQTAADLTPALQVLIGKLLRLGLISLAVVIVLSSVGIDLTALAFLSGAIGVGIGFGLQKIVSNLVSGIILLADKSIKPGDIISVGDRFGWVEELGARYTAVSTRDGREYLIPNEDLVTQSVVNWSHTSQDIRLEVKFGTGYDCDPHKVIAVATGAVRGMPRVLDEPPPVCFLTEFGDSAVNFSLGFWMSDPALGIGNLRSDVMLALWDALKREGITIPYPQRDLHLKTPVEVVLARPRTDASV